MADFQPGDRVRYVAPGGALDGVLLAWGMIGHVVTGPEAHKDPLDMQEHPCYRVMFGGQAAWVRRERLERE
jgi:hypothetical protein